MTSQYTWLKEITGGTSAISGESQQTYYFGKYNSDNLEHDVITLENEIQTYYNYNSRKAHQEYGNQTIPNITMKFNPCNPIPIYHFLGDSTSGATSGLLEIADTGTKTEFTIQHQYEFSGYQHVKQLVGAQAISLAGTIEMNMDEKMEVIYIGTEVVDEGTAPYLLTGGIVPENADSVYTGKPEVTYDGSALPDVFKVGYSCRQLTSINSLGDNNININIHEHDPVDLTLVGFLQSGTEWDTLNNKSTIDVTVRSYKGNRDYWMDKKFYNCKVKTFKKLGNLFGNEYLTTIELQSEYMNVGFSHELTGFSTWF